MVTSGFKLDAQEGERLRFGEVEILVKTTAQTTGGAFSLFEENSPVVTPLHVHEHEDELSFVIEGEHVFQVGDEAFQVGPRRIGLRPARRAPALGGGADGTRARDVLPGGPRRLLSRAGRGAAERLARSGGLCRRLEPVRHHMAGRVTV